MNEQEIKQEMSVREKPDSLLIEAGSAAKGIKVALKCYFDAANEEEINKKSTNLLKLRQDLMNKGIIV